MKKKKTMITSVIVAILLALGFSYKQIEPLLSFKTEMEASSSNTGLNQLETAKVVSTITPPSNTVPVKLDRVIDGDTLAVKMDGDNTSHKVRLLLIDTPESVKPNTPVQPYAKEASNRMKELVQGKDLQLEYDAGGATDKYGRILAYVYANKKQLNETMVREGFARVAYVYKPNTRYLTELNAAQAFAKEEKRNIWSKKGYVTDRGFQD
ncbi:endonuclease [Listeria booriae]|uniref:thermonuclease family protein n=1 Tax=Listeria booriae TaxID=1552123 RepID=UPI00162408DC|nr:thermonuclease family protein [Listeria booriae]MBC1920301.1 endonuclease [Listeria booriae]